MDPNPAGFGTFWPVRFRDPEHYFLIRFRLTFSLNIESSLIFLVFLKGNFSMTNHLFFVGFEYLLPSPLSVSPCISIPVVCRRGEEDRVPGGEGNHL
jgi:hypothetical protein